MPRISPCRVVKFILFIYLVMIWLWFSLPSPTIPPLERSARVQKALVSGEPLVTVHPWDKSFDARERGYMREGNALIIKWRLQEVSDKIILHIGEVPANVGMIIDDAKKFNEDAGATASAWAPYIGEPLRFNDTSVGDVEHAIMCLPWFHEADKHLITHAMHDSTGSMALRFVVPEPGVLELWKDAVVAHHIDKVEVKDLDVPASTEGRSSDIAKQKLWNEAWRGMKNVDREFGMLVRLRNLETGKMQDVVVEGLQGDLPSTTYPIRRALLTPLAPTLRALTLGLFFIFVFYEALSPLLPALLLIGFQLGLAGAGITLSCWLRDGRPPFGQWSREFWMTRWVYGRAKSREKRVWGPSGPVLKGELKSDGWDEEQSLGLQKPRSVKLGRGWRR